MNSLKKTLTCIAVYLFLLSSGATSAQVRDITFVVSNYGYSDIDYSTLTPIKQQTLVSAVRDVYFNFVSSDTNKFEKLIKPIIIRDSNTDFYSSLPEVILEHILLNKGETVFDNGKEYRIADKYTYAKYTISINSLISFCRKKGINCNLAKQTLGAEMKRYKFLQNATSKVYGSLYFELAGYCGFVDRNEHLYDYELKVGEPYPYEKEGLSVVPLSLVIKQNTNTRKFYNTFINVLNAMRISDDDVNSLHEKGYKTYKNVAYTLPPAKWQNEFRERNSEDRNPYFYLNEKDYVVSGEFYRPLDRHILNGIFERVLSRFAIYDNLSEKEESFNCIYYDSPYLITNQIEFVAEEVYSELSGSGAYSQYQDEIHWYISDLGYTSGAYKIRDLDNGCMVLLAMVDTGDLVTVSKTLEVIIPTDYLMKITNIDVDYACGLEILGQTYEPGIMDGADEEQTAASDDEYPDVWTYRDDRGLVIPWSQGSYMYENYQMIYDSWTNNSRPIVFKSLIKNK